MSSKIFAMKYQKAGKQNPGKKIPGKIFPEEWSAGKKIYCFQSSLFIKINIKV